MRALLLVIDYINEITHPDGKMAVVAKMVVANDVITKVNQSIGVARKKQIPIVHVKVGFSSDYIEWPAESPLFGPAKKAKALCLGTWGTEFNADVDVRPTDAIIVKHRVSALYATPLEAIISANRVDTVIVVGVSTNMAVETVVRELHDRDYRVVVIADACAAASLEVHERSLKSMERIAIICNSAELDNRIR